MLFLFPEHQKTQNFSKFRIIKSELLSAKTNVTTKIITKTISSADTTDEDVATAHTWARVKNKRGVRRKPSSWWRRRNI